jgi:hypothetical protein
LRIVEGYSAALTDLVQDGRLDFAIVPATAGIAGVKSRLFMRTPEVLVGAKAFTNRRSMEPVRTADLGALKLVAPSRANTRRLSIDQPALALHRSSDATPSSQIIRCGLRLFLRTRQLALR